MWDYFLKYVTKPFQLYLPTTSDNGRYWGSLICQSEAVSTANWSITKMLLKMASTLPSTLIPLSAVPIWAWLTHYFAIYACLHPGQKDNSGLKIEANNKVLLHLFPLISPSVLMLQVHALYLQLGDVLLFVLHTGRGLSNKWLQRYFCSGFDFQIMSKSIFKVWKTYIEEFTELWDSKIMTYKLTSDQRIEFFILTSNIS